MYKLWQYSGSLCLLVAVGLLAIVVGCNGSSTKTNPPPAANSNGSTNRTEKTEESLVPSDAEGEEYYPLSMEDFDVFSEKESETPTWTQEGEEIVCSGEPRGYIYTTEQHRNFVLKYEFRFNATSDEEEINKLNTGLLVYIQGEHKRWPVSLEVQGKHLEMCSIKPNGGAADVEITEDSAARESARKKPGEWNQVDVKSVDGQLTALLNGTKICESKAGELKEGFLGFQSEGVEVRFRNMKILDFD